MVVQQSLISQFRHENEGWKRVLVFIREENINIKNRLSDIVKYMEAGEEGMLERIEYFQNCFVEEDEKIRKFLKQVEMQDKLLLRDVYKDGGLVKQVKSSQLKLRKEMEKTEREFNRLKFEFNMYLGGVL